MSSSLSPRSLVAFAADAAQLADEVACAHGSFSYAALAAERAAVRGCLSSDLIAVASTAAANVAKVADTARHLAESLTAQIAKIEAAELAPAEVKTAKRIALRSQRAERRSNAVWQGLLARQALAREAALQFGNRTYWDALDAADPDRSCKTAQANADEASGALSRRDHGCAPPYKVLVQNVPLSWGIAAITKWLKCLESSPDAIGYHAPKGSGVVLTFDRKAAADAARRYLDDRRLMDGAPSTITTWLA